MSTRHLLALAALAATSCVTGSSSDGAGVVPDAPTYYEHIAPIVARHCVACHDASGIGPFPLTSYREVHDVAQSVAAAVDARTMPPFHVDASGKCNKFRDARVLTATEIATIDKWVSTGAPEGDPAKRPADPLAEDRLAEVSRTLDPGVDYLPSQAKDDDYRCFIVDPALTSDQFLTGYEVHPGTPSEVHHVVVYSTDSAAEVAAAKSADASDPGPGYTCFGGAMTGGGRTLAVWAPGTGATLYPKETGLRVGAGQPVIVQVHYNRPTTTDRTTIDLQLAPQVPYEAIITGVLDANLYLQPGMQHQVVSESTPLPGAAVPYRIHGVYPHMHKLGRTLHASLTQGLTEQCLVDVPDYAFAWQQFFFYDEPVVVPPGPGGTIGIECGYDTRGVTKPVTWGEGSDDEMCIAGFYVTL